jgi:hypothetical protein
MLFATTELAARIERAAARATAECTRIARERRAPLESLIEPLAGGVAAYAGAGSPFNKVAGMGFEGPLDPVHLARVEQAYARHSRRWCLGPITMPCDTSDG